MPNEKEQKDKQWSTKHKKLHRKLSIDKHWPRVNSAALQVWRVSATNVTNKGGKHLLPVYSLY